MERKTVVIYQTTPPECYGSLQLFCDAKGLKYNTFSKKPLPFKYSDFEVHRVPFFSRASIFFSEISDAEKMANLINSTEL